MLGELQNSPGQSLSKAVSLGHQSCSKQDVRLETPEVAPDQNPSMLL